MKDFLLGDDGDFIIENGDLKIGDCVEDNAMLVVGSAKGDFKQYPSVGCDLVKRIKHVNDDQSFYKLKSDILYQLKEDGTDATFQGTEATDFKLTINN